MTPRIKTIACYRLPWVVVLLFACSVTLAGDKISESVPDIGGRAEPPVEAAILLPGGQGEQVAPDVSATSTDAITRAASIDLDNPVQEEPSATASLVILGMAVPPEVSTRLSWSPAESFEGIARPTPVLVVNGVKPGPVLCLTAAIHGDELNGIEIVRQVLYNTKPESLSGAIIGVPIVNLQGFQRGSRYLPDRRDLNRYFPGNPEGSSAARIAYSFFKEIIHHCTVLVDLHTGSFARTNLPQLRADLTNQAVFELTKGFGATVVLHSTGGEGTLRRAAVEYGIPAVTVEAGGPRLLQEDAVSHSVKSIHTLLNHLGMTKKIRIWGAPEPVYYSSMWVRANVGGILHSKVKLGETVKKGGHLGTITNPITNVSERVVSPVSGRLLGMAQNQVVMPGYAAYHIGEGTDAEHISVTDGVPESGTLEAEETRQSGLEASRDPTAAEEANASQSVNDDILESD